jgi:hypothetical protein
MSTKIILTFKSPDADTFLVNTRIKLRDQMHGLRGISYTDNSGQVSFNMPPTIITDINDRAIDYRHGMSCFVEGIGEVGNFNVPYSGTIMGDIVFNGRPSEMAYSAVFNCIPGGTVTITGTATSGQVLTAHNTLTDADGIPVTVESVPIFGYNWKANGTNIVGATSDTYTLTDTEIGKTITVTISYTDNKGNSEVVSSLPTIAVTRIPNVGPTGSVTITGTAQVSQVLTALNTLADADGLGTLNYQWSADDHAITGATTNTYTVLVGDLGKFITVTISYTDLKGTFESVSSAHTAHVIAA